MLSKTTFSSLLLLACFTSAVPTPRDTYHGVSIEVQTSSLLDPVVITSPAPVELYHLTPCISNASGFPCSASKLTIDPNVHPNIGFTCSYLLACKSVRLTSFQVDMNAMECRAYMDVEGMKPWNAPFNVNTAKPDRYPDTAL